MFKSKPLFSSNLREYLNEFGAVIFTTDGKILHYKIYDVKGLGRKKITIQPHIVKDKHILGIANKKKKNGKNFMFLNFDCKFF